MVTVELFYETLCPHCHNYLVRTVQPLIALSDISNMYTLKMVPYGNAKSFSKEDGST